MATADAGALWLMLVLKMFGPQAHPVADHAALAAAAEKPPAVAAMKAGKADKPAALRERNGKTVLVVAMARRERPAGR